MNYKYSKYRFVDGQNNSDSKHVHDFVIKSNICQSYVDGISFTVNKQQCTQTPNSKKSDLQIKKKSKYKKKSIRKRGHKIHKTICNHYIYQI